MKLLWWSILVFALPATLGAAETDKRNGSATEAVEAGQGEPALEPGGVMPWRYQAVPVLFQRERGRRPGPGMRRMPPRDFPPRRGPGEGPGEGPPLPPALMDQLKDLPPEEQENIIRNNERFQQLPKEHQERILRRWRRFQTLSPEQKEMIWRRREAFQRLTPEQRQKMREMLPRWQALSEDRHKALQEEFRKMRNMSPEERETHLASEDLASRFSAEERELLKELNSIRPVPPPHRGPPRRFGMPPEPPAEPPP